MDHLGSPTCDVRLGGIYAPVRLAKVYPADQPPITYLLALSSVTVLQTALPAGQSTL